MEIDPDGDIIKRQLAEVRNIFVLVKAGCVFFGGEDNLIF
jgi:hypothetical protein